MTVPTAPARRRAPRSTGTGAVPSTSPQQRSGPTRSARATRQAPRADYPVHRLRLDNGLRVVLSPDPTSGVVGVAVHYDVGFRSEPMGRTGFAHLFEHLMFQGSESLPKLEHFRLVQSSGGMFNGSTHVDYTDYFEVLPSSALARALFLEADRMRAPRITAENLANQIDVVSEEIRLNVLNRPYGGFPWILLPPVMFTSFANAHNGYGAFEDLRAATVADCEDFFARYYTPANAVLTVCGDFELDAATDLIAAHFGEIASRPAPRRPSFAEPLPTMRREGEHVDVQAPLPAFAAGWRLPDPVGELPAYLAHVLAGLVLSDGESSRLQSTVAQAGLATDIWAGPGLLGGPLDARDPDVFVLGALHPADHSTDAVFDAALEQVQLLAGQGPNQDELVRAVARFTAGLYRDSDAVGNRTLTLGSLELLHGRAELLSELPGLLAAIEPAQVAAAAASLDPDRCALLRIVPGAAQ